MFYFFPGLGKIVCVYKNVQIVSESDYSDMEDYLLETKLTYSDSNTH